MYDKRIINAWVYKEHTFSEQNIYIEGERIAKITPKLFDAKFTIDAKDLYAIPGIIDPHTHMDLNLGWIRSVDDFSSGSKSAIYGGVTTIIDFLEPSSTIKELEDSYSRRVEEAKAAHCDYKFHATIKNPKCSLEQYVQTVLKLGMNTIKLFTTYSDSGRRTDDEHIIELLKLSEKYRVLILAHVENDDMITLSPDFTAADLCKSRPSESETTEALKLASFVEEYGGYLYMVHLSSGNTIEALKDRYPALLNNRFFVESCPQYFTLTNDLLKEENNHLFTFAPPMRSMEERELLKEHIDDISTIGTDHCPFLAKDKAHHFLKDIPLGIGGVETSFSIMHKLFKDKIIEKMTENVAKRHFLKGKKGYLWEGYDADIVLFRKEKSILTKTHSKCDYTPYFGFVSDISIEHVFLRGHHVKDLDQLSWIKGKLIKGNSNEMHSERTNL